MFSLHECILTIVIYQQQEEKVALYNRTHVGSLWGKGEGTETGLWGPELQKREKETEKVLSEQQGLCPQHPAASMAYAPNYTETVFF